MSYYYDAAACFLGEDYIEKAYEVKNALKKYKLKCRQAHAPIECYYLMAQDNTSPEYVRLKRAIESAGIIGIEHIVIVGIEVPAPHASYLNINYNYDFYKSLEPLCKQYGVIIAVENLRKSFTYPDLMNEIIRKLDSPWFKVLVDVGHTWVRADMQPGEYIRGLDPNVICGLHVHDTHGIRKGVDEHLLPWMAEIDFDDLMKALKEVGYDGDVTLEIRPFIEKYASKGLLEPALKFAEAVGRKLVSMY
ncbi:MAG: sugar phosphate isomerase/epimerase [Clostridia bacterium]|nr:sugar phosphate isomerase/epimerase [Clostridia bacterium]